MIISFERNYKSYKEQDEFPVEHLGEKDVTFLVKGKKHTLPYIGEREVKLRGVKHVIPDMTVRDEDGLVVAYVLETISPEEKVILEQIYKMPMTTKEEIQACKEASRAISDSAEKVLLFKKLIWEEGLL